ncbi:kinase activator [Lithospermum erythrorhizon]|uniref:Kinase activator n=1 Tax=Lithospermum erythrorhizon TaxID=34254 RepID=A0AAV3QJC0_LITER
MAASLPVGPSHHGVNDGGAYKVAQESCDEGGGSWYFSRREIEENSPSRLDGIDLKKETYLRKSYCTFLQDLGMRLKVPQVTIATAIIFCHRFFLRQSHAKNDRRTIATVCMFLAGKVEETPRPLKDVILVSYEIIHKKDPAAIQRIKQKEVYEQQKELILVTERLVLATLGFDLNVHHPYKPLVEAIKKFKVAQNALAQVAWNFVNDGLRTSLCLQFKPHHIAAGAIFLAAKFLKVKLPSDGEKVWWQEFDVTPRQLEEVSNQMLELYEQNRVPAAQASEAEGSAGGAQRPPNKASGANEEHAAASSNSQGGGSKASSVRSSANRSNSSLPAGENHVIPPRSQSHENEHKSSEFRGNSNRNGDIGINDQHEQEMPGNPDNKRENQNKLRFNADPQSEEDQERSIRRSEEREARELKNKYHGRSLDYKDGSVQSPHDAIKKLDKDKLKAAIEKRRKSGGNTTRKMDYMDEDDLIERELEDGIELVSESEKFKQERKQSLPKTLNRQEHDDGVDDGHFQVMKGQAPLRGDSDIVEEGEVDQFDGIDSRQASPKSNNRKRRAGSSPVKSVEGKQRQDHGSHAYNSDPSEDRSRLGRHGFPEREHEMHLQENHV